MDLANDSPDRPRRPQLKRRLSHLDNRWRLARLSKTQKQAVPRPKAA